MKRWPILLMLSALAWPAIATDGLGRLFTTPAERANLDNLRSNSKIPAIDPATAEGSEEAGVAVAPPPLVSLQGYVKRSDGKKGTVWVNRQAVQEDSANDEVRVGKLRPDSNQVQLKLSGSGKTVNLKAGQTYLPDSDSVSDAGVHAEENARSNQTDTQKKPALPSR